MIVDALRQIDPRYPRLDDAALAELREAGAELAAEQDGGGPTS